VHETLFKCHKSQTECLECPKTRGRRSGTPPLLYAPSSLALTGIHHRLLGNLTTGNLTIHRFKKKIADDSATNYFNFVINNSPHLKYAATLSLFIVNRLFSDINVLQGSVATCVRCGGILNNNFTATYRGVVQWKKI